MGRYSTGICIDREKVYGIMNRKSLSIKAISKELGVTDSTIHSWIRSGKVSKEFLDIFALALGVSEDEIKGKSHYGAGPEEIKWCERASLFHKRSNWAHVDSRALNSLIVKKYTNVTQFANHIGMASSSVHRYLSFNRIPEQYVRRFSLALDADPSEFVIDAAQEDVTQEPIDIPAAPNTKELSATNEDADEIKRLLDKVQELEAKLATYEKLEHIPKSKYPVHMWLLDEIGDKPCTFEKAQWASRLIFELTDIATGNYTFNPKTKNPRRHRYVEVDEETYVECLHEFCKRFAQHIAG